MEAEVYPIKDCLVVRFRKIATRQQSQELVIVKQRPSSKLDKVAKMISSPVLEGVIQILNVQGNSNLFVILALQNFHQPLRQNFLNRVVVNGIVQQDGKQRHCRIEPVLVPGCEGRLK